MKLFKEEKNLIEETPIIKESTEKSEGEQLEKSINEFVSEVSNNESDNQSIGNDKSGENVIFKRIDIFETIDFMPDHIIRGIVSPTKSLLKINYLEKFPENQREKVKAILTDDDKTFQVKKDLINDIVAEYCQENNISMEKFKFPSWVKLACLELMGGLMAKGELDNQLKLIELSNKNNSKGAR